MRDQVLGGRYRLVRELGEGGMGQVWEARDETLDRPVAVKLISLLSGGGSRGEEARARFLREARITARLQHAHIVTIHDLGETDAADGKVPFLVMELVPGESLDALLRRGGVSLSDAARWGAQVADALTDAHAAGIMHRDIKPSNILITPSGNAKVLDFGVARAADPNATADRLTQTGFIVGTPPYMAPEQARGHPEPRSDLYALGCVLFELIVGRLPFQAPDTVGYLSAHLTEEPPAPSTVSPDLPPEWDDLVLTLLRKDPAQRYANAGEVTQALRRFEHAPAAPAPSRVRGPVPPTAVLPEPAAAQSPGGVKEAIERFLPPAVLAAASAAVIRPELPMSLEQGYTGPHETIPAVVYVILLAGCLGLTAALTPRTSDAVRYAGYVATALLMLSTAPFDDDDGRALLPLAILSCALFCFREHRSRGPGNARPLSATLAGFAAPFVALIPYGTGFGPVLDFGYTVYGTAGSVGLVVLVCLTALLTPQSRDVARKVGYGAAALCALVAVYKIWLSLEQDYKFDGGYVGVGALAIAAYCYREVTTRRAAPADSGSSLVGQLR
ncbi:serine/threonine-protein kinase [Streptomyces coryli]|uniref:serine/threonine-protein kinase n=1 Tax=Streptomyces coryli TaxID=1128680 RepID=UPI0030B902A4